MDDMKDRLRDILVKKPFFEIGPQGYMAHGMPTEAFADDVVMPNDRLWRTVKTQDDFLREYYPTGHRIFDSREFPDIVKENPDYDPKNPACGQKYYIQPVARTAFAFQQVIATKHTLHLTGNDIQFELAGGDDFNKEEQNQQMLTAFRKGWLLDNMEIRFFEAVRSLMIVAEAAVVGFFNEGKFQARTLSFMDGDTLFPQFDHVTGELTLFARRYYDYDEDGRKRTEWIEVWDNTFLRRYKRAADGNSVVQKIKSMFGLYGYELVAESRHGFPFVPVSYMRIDSGPCWAPVQRNIEDYEEAFSYLTEANKAFAFPIFYVKGDGNEISLTGDTNGSVKAVTMKYKDNDAGFLNGTDASDAFATQLNKSYELIYELSFTVKPPELKSGDLPGVALKLLYSPALEAAMNDAQTMQPFLDKLVKMAKFGIGHEHGNEASMLLLPVNAWIEPYIHQNDTELVTNLATMVQNKFISKQTASERVSKYAKNDEFERIMREQKEEDQQDLLIQIEQMQAQTDNAIKEQQATARIASGQTGSDINTGHGKKGRPNRTGKQWDENGNWPGRNNWDRTNN